MNTWLQEKNFTRFDDLCIADEKEASRQLCRTCRRPDAKFSFKKTFKDLATQWQRRQW